MPVDIRALELPDYPKTHPRQAGDRAYLLDHAGAYFGLLYVAPTSYTLAWDGGVDFQQIEAEVARVVELTYSPSAVNLRAPEWRNHTRVALVRPESSDSDEVFKLWLKVQSDFDHYVQALAGTIPLAFARYDFTDNGHSPPFLSVIAENAALPTGTPTEVALVLPREKPLTEPLFAWVIEHHVAADRLRAMVDMGRCVQTVNDRLGGE